MSTGGERCKLWQLLFQDTYSFDCRQGPGVAASTSWNHSLEENGRRQGGPNHHKYPLPPQGGTKS